MNLSGFKTAVVDALDAIPEVEAGDWVVHRDSTDAVQPPCFVLDWGPDPSRRIESNCTDAAQLEVVAVAGRLTPEGAYPILEAMWDAACTALAAARLRSYQSTGPGPLEVARVMYLSVRIQLRRPIEGA